MKNHRSLFVAFVCCALMACARRAPAAGGSVHIVVSPGLSALDIARVRVTVTGAAIATPIQHDLVFDGSAWQGTLFQIPAGDDTFTAEAFDPAGQLLLSGSSTVTVAPPATALVAIVLHAQSGPPFQNHAPVISSVIASTDAPQAGQVVTLSVVATDADGDPLTYVWTASAGTIAGAGASASWTAPAAAGQQTVTVAVSDGKGATDTFSISFQVSAAQGAAQITVTVDFAPQITALTANPSRIAAGQSTALALTLQQGTGALTYSWTSDCDGAFSDPALQQPVFQLNTAPSSGSCTLTVVVTDALGGQTTGALGITAAAQSAPRFAPQIVLAFASATAAGAAQSVFLDVQARDPQGSALSFGWTASLGTLGTPGGDGAGFSSVTWTAPPCLPAAGAAITATVTDALGLATSQIFTIVPLAAAVCPTEVTWTHWSPSSQIPLAGLASVSAFGKPLLDDSGIATLASGGQSADGTAFAQVRTYSLAAGWSDPVTIGSAASPPAIGVDAAGDQFFAWVDPAGRPLVLNEILGGALQAPAVEDGNGTNALLAVEPGGAALAVMGHPNSATPFAAFYDPQLGWRSIGFPDTNVWVVLNAVADRVGTHVHGVVTYIQLGNPFASIRAAELDYDLAAQTWQWIGPLLVSTTGGNIVVNTHLANDQILITLPIFPPTGVAVASATFGGPFTDTVLSASGHAFNARLAADRSGHAVAIWLDSDDGRTFREMSSVMDPGGSWQAPVQLSDPAEATQQNVIGGMDPAGAAIAAWGVNQSTDSGLVHTARWTPAGGWQTLEDIPAPNFGGLNAVSMNDQGGALFLWTQVVTDPDTFEQTVSQWVSLLQPP